MPSWPQVEAQPPSIFVAFGGNMGHKDQYRLWLWHVQECRHNPRQQPRPPCHHCPRVAVQDNWTSMPCTAVWPLNTYMVPCDCLDTWDWHGLLWSQKSQTLTESLNVAGPWMQAWPTGMVQTIPWLQLTALITQICLAPAEAQLLNTNMVTG